MTYMFYDQCGERWPLDDLAFFAVEHGLDCQRGSPRHLEQRAANDERAEYLTRRQLCALLGCTSASVRN